MTTLTDRATAAYRDREQATSESRIERIRKRRAEATDWVAGVLEVDPGALDLAPAFSERERPSGNFWQFRYDRMTFWIKAWDEDPGWRAFVVSVNGGDLPFRTLEQLGGWIAKNLVRA